LPKTDSSTRGSGDSVLQVVLDKLGEKQPGHRPELPQPTEDRDCGVVQLIDSLDGPSLRGGRPGEHGEESGADSAAHTQLSGDVRGRRPPGELDGAGRGRGPPQRPPQRPIPIRPGGEQGPERARRTLPGLPEADGGGLVGQGRAGQEGRDRSEPEPGAHLWERDGRGGDRGAPDLHPEAEKESGGLGGDRGAEPVRAGELPRGGGGAPVHGPKEQRELDLPLLRHGGQAHLLVCGGVPAGERDAHGEDRPDAQNQRAGVLDQLQLRRVPGGPGHNRPDNGQDQKGAREKPSGGYPAGEPPGGAEARQAEREDEVAAFDAEASGLFRGVSVQGRGYFTVDYQGGVRAVDREERSLEGPGADRGESACCEQDDEGHNGCGDPGWWDQSSRGARVAGPVLWFVWEECESEAERGRGHGLWGGLSLLQRVLSESGRTGDSGGEQDESLPRGTPCGGAFRRGFHGDFAGERQAHFQVQHFRGSGVRVRGAGGGCSGRSFFVERDDSAESGYLWYFEFGERARLETGEPDDEGSRGGAGQLHGAGGRGLRGGSERDFQLQLDFGLLPGGGQEGLREDGVRREGGGEAQVVYAQVFGGVSGLSSASFEGDEAHRQLMYSKNSLEALIYDNRNKLYDDIYQKVTLEEERDDITKLLSETEDWLYEIGDNITLELVEDKISTVSNRTGLIHIKAEEFKYRSELIANVDKKLNLTVQTFEAIQFTHTWVQNSTFDEVKNLISEFQTWYNDTKAKQSELKPTDQPVLLRSEALKRLEGVVSNVQRVRSIPKPRPKIKPKPKNQGDIPSNSTSSQQSSTAPSGNATAGPETIPSATGANSTLDSESNFTKNSTETPNSEKNRDQSEL
ncbi:APG-1-like HSP70 domain-containing protein, partial [Cryptosporidium canis]